MKREGRAGKGRHAERRRKGGDSKAGRTGAGRGLAGRAAVALCNPLAGRGLCRGTGSGRGGHFCPTQRRKRPLSCSLPGDRLRWGTPGL